MTLLRANTNTNHECYGFHWFVDDDRFSWHVHEYNFEFFVARKELNITLG